MKTLCPYAHSVKEIRSSAQVAAYASFMPGMRTAESTSGGDDTAGSTQSANNTMINQIQLQISGDMVPNSDLVEKRIVASQSFDV